MSELSTFPLRLLRSIRDSLARLAKREGVSMNQFVSLAVAGKLAMLEAETYFAERQARADLDAFDRLMRRKDSETPRAGGEV